MAAEGDRDDQLKSRGMDPIAAELGLNLLGRLLESNHANVAVMDVRWPEMIRAMAGRVPSLLKEFASEDESIASAANDAVDYDLRGRLLESDIEQRQALLREYLTGELARVTGLAASDLNPQQPLSELGMDSLLAMELKNNLERRLAFTLPMAAFLDKPRAQAGREVHWRKAPHGQVARGKGRDQPKFVGATRRRLVASACTSRGRREGPAILHPPARRRRSLLFRGLAASDGL
jgi:hypothetical protein